MTIVANRERMSRDGLATEQAEGIRKRLIVARVMSGLTEVEAAERLGYANSTQLNLIESGKRPIPGKHQASFLMDFARIYSVSVDFLLGISPHMEPDGKVAHEYAIARRVEEISSGIANMLATAMIQYTDEVHPVVMDYQRIMVEVDGVNDALMVLRDRFGFDDVPGGARLAGAIARLIAASEPMRAKLAKFKGIEDRLAELRDGRNPSIEHLDKTPEKLADDVDTEVRRLMRNSRGRNRGEQNDV